jgi:RHS repeat-associated protein
VDQLESTRVLTDSQGNVKEWHDFMPFGDELLAGVGGRTTAQGYLSSGTTPGVSVLFTGQYRDTELASSQTPSGLDYFRGRHYAQAFGRFLQPDPVGSIVADPENPQSWHLYSYVWNNPFRYVDPTGLDVDQVGNCYWNTRTDPETGRTTYVGSPVCFDQGSGTGSDGSSTTPDSHPNPSVPQTIKQKICSAIPSGRTIGASGGVGGVGSPGGGGEVLMNYNSGQVSVFGFGGLQIGWNGVISGSVYTGFVWGLNNSNSNYSGGFTGVNAGAGLGGFAASSSGGLTGGPGQLIPNPRDVTAAGVSFGAGLVGAVSGGVTATNYSKPAQLGKFWAFTQMDWLLYAARQVCK